MVVTKRKAVRKRKAVGKRTPGRWIGRPVLVDAIRICGGRRGFARLAGVQERTVGRWLAGSREISPPAYILAFAITVDPHIVPFLEGVARASTPRVAL